MGFLLDLLTGYDPGEYKENLDGSGEWVGGRDSAEANRREEAEREKRERKESGPIRRIMQEPKIEYYQFLKVENLPQKLIDAFCECYSFQDFLRDFRKDEGITWSDKQIAQRLYDEIKAYEQIDKILQADPDSQDKIMILMPTYNKDRKNFLNNIKRNKEFMEEITYLTSLDKKLEELTNQTRIDNSNNLEKKLQNDVNIR